jgi:cysteine desulfurase/selenocysteine lyase
MVMQKTALSVQEIRQDFPILKRKVGVNGSKPLVYLDNAATTQKPYAVINAINEYYSNYNANIHRAVHQLGEEATAAYEQTRRKVAKFINARSVDEIIFTRNATEAINLVAYSWGRKNVKRGDTIVLTEMEHHSNIVPWQILSREKKSKVCYLGIDDQGYLKIADYDRILKEEDVRLVSVSEMSNVLGTIVPLKDIVKMAHEDNIPVFVDAAQSVPHLPVDVQKTECDFLAFSAHKMLGPTGVGVLYVKKEILQEMPPFIGGGDMIREVHKQNTIYNDLPYRFEGGTQNIAGVVGFSAALDYLAEIGMDKVRRHELEITRYALSALNGLKDVTIYGPQNFNDRGGLISFNIADIHPHDLATIMNEHGIAIRSGHHCAQVLMERLDVAATSRASFYLYNTKEEVNLFVDALIDARRIFRI